MADSDCGDKYRLTRSILSEICDDESLNHLIDQLRQSSNDASRFMDWAGSEPLLKVVETPVADGVLPEGVSGMLADVKVNSRGRPDDAVYDQNESFRKRVARGNSFLSINGGKWQSVIYALKKFTGGMGDDDDRGNGGDKKIWQRYFTKSYEDADRVVAIRKANGEAAHFSCLKIQGSIYLCIGSKNVHMLIRRTSDIDKYTESRYEYARDIAHTVMEFLQSLDKPRLNRLLEFLCETRYTAVMEILNPSHQHVEDLSYLDDKCSLKFISWTSTNMNESDELCVMAPDLALKLAQHLGFDSLEYRVITAVEAEQHMLQIRKQHGYEGEVLYYLDSDGSVIGLLKKKTAWYIILRAIREKARNSLSAKTQPNKGETSKKVKKRIGEIQRWLNLDDDSTRTWQDLGTAFINWMSDNHIQRNDIADKFPVTWNKFLKETEHSDHIEYSDASVD